MISPLNFILFPLIVMRNAVSAVGFSTPRIRSEDSYHQFCSIFERINHRVPRAEGCFLFVIMGHVSISFLLFDYKITLIKVPAKAWCQFDTVQPYACCHLRLWHLGALWSASILAGKDKGIKLRLL